MSFIVDIGRCSERGQRSLNGGFAGAVQAPPAEAWRGLVAAVAAGVSAGGHGLEAAQSTVMGLPADYFAKPDNWETTVVLVRLIGAQNAWLTDHNRRRHGAGRGAALTTLTALTALALRGQTWTLAHLGDSRAWRVRGTAVAAAAASGDEPGAAVELMQLSTDHARQLQDELAEVRRLDPPPLLKVGDRLDGHVITALVADTGLHRL